MLREVLQDINLRRKELFLQKRSKMIGLFLFFILLLLFLYFFIKTTTGTTIDLCGVLYEVFAICVIYTEILNELIPYRLPKLFHYLPLDKKEKETYLKLLFALKLILSFAFVLVLNIWCIFRLNHANIEFLVFGFVEMEVCCSVLLFGKWDVFLGNKNSYFAKHKNKKVKIYTKSTVIIWFLGVILLPPFRISGLQWSLWWIVPILLFLMLSIWYFKNLFQVMFPELFSLGMDYEVSKEYIKDERLY